MLRLWPKKINIGLFGEHAWIAPGGGRPLPRGASVPNEGPRIAGPSLDSVLDDFTDSIPKGAEIALVVSDAIASIVTLPWQARVTQPEELLRYAQLCFERCGMTIGTDWILRAEFRHFGGIGLAYALPRSYLLEAETSCRARGLRLARILPASAGAYYAISRPKGTACAVWLLGDERRVTALVYGSQGLLGHDVEPMTSDPALSVMRILRRTGARYGPPQRLALWTPFEAVPQHLRSAIAESYPEIEIQLLNREALHT